MLAVLGIVVWCATMLKGNESVRPSTAKSVIFGGYRLSPERVQLNGQSQPTQLTVTRLNVIINIVST